MKKSLIVGILGTCLTSFFLFVYHHFSDYEIQQNRVVDQKSLKQITKNKSQIYLSKNTISSSNIKETTPEGDIVDESRKNGKQKKDASWMKKREEIIKENILISEQDSIPKLEQDENTYLMMPNLIAISYAQSKNIDSINQIDQKGQYVIIAKESITDSSTKQFHTLYNKKTKKLAIFTGKLNVKFYDPYYVNEVEQENSSLELINFIEPISLAIYRLNSISWDEEISLIYKNIKQKPSVSRINWEILENQSLPR